MSSRAHAGHETNMANKLRKLGDVLLDLEVYLEELSFAHDLQHGEVLGLIHSWLKIHAPSQVETYLDGSEPIFIYGPRRTDK